MHEAVAHGTTGSVEWLLTYGADPTLRTGLGDTALTLAQRSQSAQKAAITALLRTWSPPGG